MLRSLLILPLALLAGCAATTQHGIALSEPCGTEWKGSCRTAQNDGQPRLCTFRDAATGAAVFVRSDYTNAATAKEAAEQVRKDKERVGYRTREAFPQEADAAMVGFISESPESPRTGMIVAINLAPGQNVLAYASWPRENTSAALQRVQALLKTTEVRVLP